jgi:hypothetical protein
MKMRSQNDRIADRFSAFSNGSSSATPTAAPAADQPTNWRATSIQLIPNNEAENTVQERHLCIT